MQTQRWLATYVDMNGKQRAAMISGVEPGKFPFGVDEFELGLDAYDGEPVLLIEMPNEPDFRPMVADVIEDIEIGIQFIDL